MLFISHAVPEENEFARWLSLRLASAGFVVWSDVTKLLGGEKFWSEIETAIKQHTDKFLLCISSNSQARAGVLRELDWAIATERDRSVDLVVPLKLDSTSFAAFPRGLGAEVNAIRFDHGWATGLSQILAMLKRDGIKPTNDDGVSVVRESWNRWFPASEGLTAGRDECVSNLFPTLRTPGRIWFHPASRHVQRSFRAATLPVLAEGFSNGFVSFCDPEEMQRGAPRFGIRVNESKNIEWATFVEQGFEKISLKEQTARRFATALLRRAFERHAEKAGATRYLLANDKACFWLKSGFLKNDEGSFRAGDGKEHRRSLVGYKTMVANKDGIRSKRLWHFAVQGVPAFEPDHGIILKTHLVFSPDGETPYPAARYQHRARRNQGKNWWNDKWRDRLFTMVNVLAGGLDELSISVAKGADFTFSTSPVRFIADMRYAVVDQQAADDLPNDDDLPESDDGEDND